MDYSLLLGIEMVSLKNREEAAKEFSVLGEDSMNTFDLST